MGHHLVSIARHCHDSGIGICGPGQPINVIGETIRYVHGDLESKPHTE